MRLCSSRHECAGRKGAKEKRDGSASKTTCCGYLFCGLYKFPSQPQCQTVSVQRAALKSAVRCFWFQFPLIGHRWETSLTLRKHWFAHRATLSSRASPAAMNCDVGTTVTFNFEMCLFSHEEEKSLERSVAQ